MKQFLRRHGLNLLMLLVGFGFVLNGYVLLQQNNSVDEACKIQQRGLKASDHLTRFFEDWSDLTQLQLRQAATLRQLRLEPPRQRLLTTDALTQLQAYAKVQRQQPKQRSCS